MRMAMRSLLKSAKPLKSWCGRWDSNPHWKDFKSSVSTVGLRPLGPVDAFSRWYLSSVTDCALGVNHVIYRRLNSTRHTIPCSSGTLYAPLMTILKFCAPKARQWMKSHFLRFHPSH